MSISAPVASIVVAVLSALISVVSLRLNYTTQDRLEGVKRETERFKSTLLREEEEARRTREAQELVSRYRDPLLRTAYDLQSRLYNVLGPNKFGRSDSDDNEYFRLNTLFVVGDFLGWLEIIRRDMQFLDVGAVDQTNDLNRHLETIQDWLASTTKLADPYYLYRGQQRAIGEIMTAPIGSAGTRPGPRYETIGFAEFCTRIN